MNTNPSIAGNAVGDPSETELSRRPARSTLEHAFCRSERVMGFYRPAG